MDNLFSQGKVRCLAMVAYGKSTDQIRLFIETSFYPKSVIDRLLKILPEIENKKLEIKFPVNIPGIK